MPAVAAAKPAPAVKPPAKVSALDAIRALAAAKTGGKGKSETPAVERPDLASVLAAWEDNKAKEAHYKSLAATAEAQLRAAGRDERLKLCTDRGTVFSTVKIKAGDRSVNVTTTSKYCKLDPAKAPAIKAALIEADFEEAQADLYFAEQLDLGITDAGKDDAGYQDFLVELVGVLSEKYGDRFTHWFKVTQEFAPTKAFHEAYSINPKLRAAVQPFVDDETIKGYAPSLKK